MHHSPTSTCLGKDWQSSPIAINPWSETSGYALSEMDLVRHLDIAEYYPGTERDYLTRRFQPKSLPSPRSHTLFIIEKHNELLGFFVLAVKEGGLTKLGPVWLSREARGQSLFSSIVAYVSAIQPNRFVYMTAPSDNFSIVSSAKKAGFISVAAVPDLYRVGSTELYYHLGRHEYKSASIARRIMTSNNILQTICRLGVKPADLSDPGLLSSFENACVKRGGAICLNSSSPSPNAIHAVRRTPFSYSTIYLSSCDTKFSLPPGWELQRISAQLAIIFGA
ncbi:hypothetical protein C8N35_1157 [Breoghania corrubedonensis]|uniref:N-acetyltransferase domain-containing protein n=1 Tax=Breoghania corrubedonensis TaxID=665038 RepID=A0A2T5UQU6_9HYPH|nr:hypothetical protein [Breoghania corrubedonensis]PTW53887.1 hypothetical protein C8N35_1157 [Breoghania corrubedonensis]